MSVASDIVPEVFIPARARPGRASGEPSAAARSQLRWASATASPLPDCLPDSASGSGFALDDVALDRGSLRSPAVRRLQHPSSPPAVEPVRLTSLGRVVLAAFVAAVSLAFVALCARSTPSAGEARPGPSVLTVRPGDTLWSIATVAAPNQDPRAEVAYLQRRNHLADVDVVPGQVLRLR